MKRLTLAVLLVVSLAGLPVTGVAAEAGSSVRLRNWHFGLQSVGTRRNSFDVFEVATVPDEAVAKRGRGAGLFVGYRFGERFLLDLQMTYGLHDITGSTFEMGDAEVLVTGTVLFRHTSTWQPFLRGGFGGAGQVLQLQPDGGQLTAYGTAAIAGGGVQVRLSSRFSLEFEAVATFANFLEVRDESAGGIWSGGNWQVRRSNYGSRAGLGLVVWF